MRSLALIALLAALAAVASSKSDKKIVCYFGSWAVYRPGEGKFDISYIEPSLCTHMIYTFVGITEDGNVRVLDAWQDLPDNWGKDAFGRFNALREKSPSTKTMIAIGGWNEGSAKYSHVAANPATRAKFVKNVVAFVKKYNFDGFDLDWEYPAQRGGDVANDKQNYIALLKELREEFDKHDLILSAAVGAAEQSASQSYIIKEATKYLHMINLMAYDLHGSWESFTGSNAPMYRKKGETGAQAKLNVDSCVKYWLDQGADPQKLILGTAFYGRSFTLADPKKTAVGSPTTGPGAKGPYTREPGMLGYNEICTKLRNNEFTQVWDDEQHVPYAYNDRQWVGYDDTRSIAEKAEYVKKMNLGGAMLWSIETDDFRGKCGEKYPLLKTLNSVLRNGKPVSTDKPNYQPTTESTSDESNNNQEPVQPEPEPEPEKPITPIDPSVCDRAGFVRDPKDCTVFYQCVQSGNSFTPSRFTCADGLVFDEKLKVCNYRSAVKC